MRCCACGKEVRGLGRVYGLDGDLVCDEVCEQKMRDQLTYLCEKVFPSEQATEDFILGKTDYPEELK